MAALTFTPSGNGLVGAQVLSDATSTMVLFLNVEAGTKVTLLASQDGTNFARLFGEFGAENAGAGPEGFNVAIPIGWTIDVDVQSFKGSPTIVIE